ncbi:hypothetical protein NW766_001665 [Fusarium irregulare]|uniref:Uncharacterized protein n=1 Tax=Fusarium irregulare TaxID=2494466 RepID=A0A9W8UFL6_9HYPO|nr:hypothetical protein NW766_001665 [Fusarium irregulare]
MATPGFSGGVPRENNAPEVYDEHLPEHVLEQTTNEGTNVAAQTVAKVETASQVIENPTGESKPSLICGTEEQSRSRRARQLIMVV